MRTLSDKVRFVQRKLKPEEAFMTKKWMVLVELLLAQAHIYIYMGHSPENWTKEGAAFPMK